MDEGVLFIQSFSRGRITCSTRLSRFSPLNPSLSLSLSLRAGRAVTKRGAGMASMLQAAPVTFLQGFSGLRPSSARQPQSFTRVCASRRHSYGGIHAFFNLGDEPLVKEALKEPVAFLGGVFAGLLRLDLNEEPLRDWVARTAEAAGIDTVEPFFCRTIGVHP